MATTNFTRLTSEQLTVWQRDLWKNARNKSFIMSFAGTSADSLVQRVTELKSSEKGARAVMTLVPDLEGDGVVGDNTLEGREEEIKAFDQVIQIDQLRNANRLEGRMADQRSVVNFREQSKDVLAYWLANKIDELAFQTLAGVSYSLRPNLSTRVGSELPLLDFAGDVSVPTTNRQVRWDAASSSLVSGSSAATGNVTANDLPTWKAIVNLKAYAVDQYIKPIRSVDGVEAYVLFMTPRGMARLKQDADFINIMKDAGVRGDASMFFKGTPHAGKNGIMLDGIYICEYRNVPNTTGLAGGSKWGGGSVEGQAALFCGAQALGLADIGMPRWDEETYDYGNSNGIAISKIFGLKKPVWRSVTTGANEDFSVIRWNTAI